MVLKMGTLEYARMIRGDTCKNLIIDDEFYEGSISTRIVIDYKCVMGDNEQKKEHGKLRVCVSYFLITF